MAGGSSDLRVITQVVESALGEIHSITPAHDRVQAAQHALAQAKASLNPSDAFTLAVELFQPLLVEDQNPLATALYARVHFAFHILEERILPPIPWAAAPVELKANLRRLGMLVLTSVGKQPSKHRFPSWVIQKAASLIAAIAAREWPQHWPDFVDSIINEAIVNGTHDASCEVFRILSEDVHDFGDDIVSSRRQELSRALSLTLDQILGFVKNTTEVYFQSSNIAGVDACLRTLTAFLTWCNVEQAIDAGVPTACVAMLRHPAARDQALEALQGFVSRKPAGQQGAAYARSTFLFRDVMFPALIAYICDLSLTLRIVAESTLPVPMNIFPVIASVDSLPDAEEHHFVVKFVRMMADLGISYYAISFLPFSTSGKELSEDCQRVAVTYFEFMLASIAHPSLMIRDSSLRFFSAFYVPPLRLPESREGHISAGSKAKAQLATPSHGSVEAANTTSTGRELLIAMASGFIHGATLAVLKPSFDSLAVAYAELDFDGEDDELQETTTWFENRIMTTVASATAMRPLEALEIALRRMEMLIHQLVRLHVTTTPDANAPWRCDLIVSLPSLPNAWEFGSFTKGENLLLAASTDAVFRIAEAAIAGANASGVSSSDCTIALLMKLFDSVVSIENVALFAQRVAAFRVFVPLFSRDAPRLQRALHLLVRQAAASGLKTEARYRACQALASLCRRIVKSNPRSLNDSRVALCEFAAQALREDDLSCQEKSQLLEAAVICILTLDEIAEQSMWLETLLSPLLEKMDPSADWSKRSFQSPHSLFRFFDEGDPNLRDSFFTSLYLLEFSTHHVVREQSHSALLKLPTPLSGSIAARSVEFCFPVIKSIHGMYNVVKFPVEDGSKYQSALLPSSREIVNLLQLDGAGKLNGIEAPEMFSQALSVGRAPADRADDVLSRFDLRPPSPEHRQIREALKVIRNGSYELIRNSILSGVTSSPKHLCSVLEAISSDFQFLEPLHLYYLVNRVIRVLVSHTVVAANASYLQSVSESDVPGIIRLMTENIENLGASQVIASNNPTLDFAREHSRLKLCRAAADLLVALFPKAPDPTKKDESAPIEKYLPATMNAGTPLGNAVWSLLQTMCGPDVARAESGAASRIVCNLVSRVCEYAPDGAASQYAELLVPCLQTAVVNHRRASDDSAVNAISSITLRFSDASLRALEQWTSNELSEIQGWILTACGNHRKDLAPEANIRRNSRATIRKLIERISEHSGFSSQRSKAVHPLATPLIAVNPVRNAARMLQESNDDLLADTALDSLFGAGEPM
jgi:hypothetical protein